MRRGLRKDLLLLFALLADARGELSTSTVYRRLWWTDYKPKSLYAVVSRMVKVGEISRFTDSKGEAKIVMNARGWRLLDEVLPLRKLQRKKWDGKWRFVIFDIPEKAKGVRDRLRSKLKELGFGMWQKSVYVTAYDFMSEMNEYLEEQELYPLVVCFESRRAGVGDDREFADLVFATEKRNSKYGKLFEQAKALSYVKELQHIGQSAFEHRFAVLWTKYLKLVDSEPFLPYELLPKQRYGDEVREKLQRLMKSVK